jgi:hypothetical protein
VQRKATTAGSATPQGKEELEQYERLLSNPKVVESSKIEVAAAMQTSLRFHPLRITAYII